MKRTLLVTGGIGSGKSLVCAMLARRGLPVYDADARTRSLYDDPAFFARVEEALGVPCHGPDGRPDRAAMARLVFSDPAALARLEAVVHPAMRADFLRWRAAQASDWVVLESAILLDKPLLRDLPDFILRVEADPSVRLERAVRRDGCDPAGVRARMAAQPEPCVPADRVLRNDASPEQLEREVDAFFSYLCKQ